MLNMTRLTRIATSSDYFDKKRRVGTKISLLNKIQLSM